RYTTTFALAAPRITGTNVESSILGPLSSIRVTFSKAIDPATFTLADLTFTRGATAIPVTSISAVAGSNNTQFDINFATQSLPGNYALVIAADVRDFAGNQLDQNNNRIPGEVSADRFTLNFSIVGLRVTYSSAPDVNGG